VILPASAFPEKTGTFTNTDRRVQLGRQALDPPGDARQDLWIIGEIARRLGLSWNYAGPAQVFEEIRLATPSIGRDHLGAPGGRGIVHVSARARKAIPANPRPSSSRTFRAAGGRRAVRTGRVLARRRDARPEYPFIFTTGRQLEHWHTGSNDAPRASRSSTRSNPIRASWSIHPDDIAEAGIEPGRAPITRGVAGPRGKLNRLRARPTGACKRGTVAVHAPFRLQTDSGGELWLTNERDRSVR